MEASEVTSRESIFDREIKDIKSFNFWRAVIAEYIGTLILFQWSIGSSLHDPEDQSPPDPLIGAICTGFVVAVVINSLLNVSGGHVNPAVSIGFLVLGKITFIRFIFYVCAQCLAGLSAVAILSKLTPEGMIGLPALISPAPGVTNVQAFFIEFSIDFFLLFSIAALIDDKRPDDTSPTPFYVGLIVVGNILFAARTSGGCMNPARNFGPAILAGNLETQWVYWLGPLLGAASGAFLYDKFLSAAAMSGSVFLNSCCKNKSDEQKTTRPAESSNNEKECMLTTEA
ncbi:aquaporin AQPAe.a-like [Ruditapes philippinarum]|uniref:aquaporin AQPAe.a-like n=1 Tax=Ruditapes philippinarum TaxID=129788 RepID=UPI00295B0D9E|nr:aquaporin AQPAe.a-like [Ruditapes philippinarum]